MKVNTKYNYSVLANGNYEQQFSSKQKMQMQKVENFKGKWSSLIYVKLILETILSKYQSMQSKLQIKK